MDTTNRRRRALVGALASAAALTLAACATDAARDASPRSARDEVATVPTTTTTIPTAGDTAALCAIFRRLAASGAGRGAQFEESTPAGWEQRIATTGEIVEVAPAEWHDEAETYLQMVKDRAQLAAEHGDVGVDDLPVDVRTAFIASHRAMQAEVNELIAYMGRECGAA